jgi:hypothetical protein
MSVTEAAAIPVTTGPTGLFWSQLLSRLKKRELIPVVGPDAIRLEDEGVSCTLDSYLARRVAAYLAVEPGEAPTLHAVACLYLKEAGQLDDVYSAINDVYSSDVLARMPLQIPEALRKLARIDAFPLYVTTTFDDLLLRAVNQERFGGRELALSLAYAPKRMDDLPVPLDKLAGPTVYHLLGRVSALPEYAVTEEDTLEFVHTLQSATKGLEKLLAALRTHSILLIGSGYPDWLMRFFLRLAKGDRLLVASKPEFVVDARSRNDASLGHFLRHFSAQTKVFPGGAIEFIDELSRRWEDAGGGAPPPPAAPAATGEHPVFISYASEDRPQVQPLVNALRSTGVPVWFDESGGADGLQGGDDFEKVIGRAIRDASFFAPVLSRSVLTPERRFFRVEWTAALEQDKQAAPDQKFIVPLRLGDLSPATPAIPERFRSLKWLPLGEGGELDATVRYLREQYEQFRAARSAPR